MVGASGPRRVPSFTMLIVSVLLSTVPPIVAFAQPGPAVRPRGPIVAHSALSFGAVSQIVPLSGGRLLVADATKRILLMLDSSLGNARVVLDSVAGRQNSFTVRSFLLSYRGDSALFFDNAPGVFVVIDPDGRLVVGENQLFDGNGMRRLGSVYVQRNGLHV